MSVHDGLTQLFNRFGLERNGEEIFTRLIGKYDSVQVLFTDLDDMKDINDKWGHEAGDTALRAVAQILRDSCGEESFIMRYGGDEFVIIAPGPAADLKTRILEAADRWNESSGKPFRIGMSIGRVFASRKEQCSLDECIREADIRMYGIKTARKVGR